MKKSDLHALIGSRICHDLTSPLGAIGNGVELLRMSGMVPGAEMSLISDSVDSANARIRFLRVAYGTAGAEQRIAGHEVASILADLGRGTRYRMDCECPRDLPRIEAKLGFLLVQCMECAMPRGGQISLHHDGRIWSVVARSRLINHDPALWGALEPGAPPAPAEPGRVQFHLLPELLRQMGRALEAEWGEDSLRLRA